MKPTKIKEWICYHILLKRDLSRLDDALEELRFYRKHQMENSNRQTVLLEQINDAIQEIKKGVKFSQQRKMMSDTSIYLLNKLISRVEGK